MHSEAGRAAKVEAFRRLHVPGSPFVIPNPWDVGSARMLEKLGFAALATTSSGFALSLGRSDYGVTREEALAHCATLVGAVEVPVSADLENGFGMAPQEAATTVELAAATGLAGGSIEDSTGERERPVFELSLAVERVAAAVDAARAVDGGFVLTARAEAFLYGDTDLDALVARLQAFSQVGAEVLYAPGIRELSQVRALCAALDKPLNVLPMGALCELPLAAFAEAGVARISTGGRLARVAYGSLIGFADAQDDRPFALSQAVASNMAATREYVD